MTEEEKKELYQQLSLMAQNTGEDHIDEKEFYDYLDDKGLIARNAKNAVNNEQSVTEKETTYFLSNKIRRMMKRDTIGFDLIKDKLPGEASKVTQELAKTEAKAKEKKLFDAQRNREIQKAREDMKALNKQRIEADKKRLGVVGTSKYAGASLKASENSGRWEHHIMHDYICDMGIGEDGVRNNAEVYQYPTQFQASNGANIPLAESENIQHTYNNGKCQLNGKMYKPANAPQNGKYVLCLSGSGHPAGKYMQNFAAPYLKSGATVVNFDYRGFGTSTNLDKEGNPSKTKVSEQNLYKDAREMYNYLVNVKKVRPCDIIIHGYSMGGPIAAKLAADVSQNNQVKDKELQKQGKYLSETQRLGGLVLHSPMPSNYYAFQQQAVEQDMLGKKSSFLAGFLGKAIGGSFDLSKHMGNLKKYDPNIPVHYVGGKTHDDWLSPKATRVHENPDTQFENQSYHFSNCEHDSPIDSEDPFINELAKKGRAANLPEKFAQIHKGKSVDAVKSSSHLQEGIDAKKEDIQFWNSL